MKKLIALLLCCAMIFSLAGCGNNSADEEDDAMEYKIGIAQFGDHNSLDNCRKGFLEGLEEEGIVRGENLEVIYQSAQFDTGTANQVAASLVAQDVDLLCGIATPMAQSAFNAAEGTDIPVIFTAVTDPEAAMLTEGNVTGTSDKLPVEAQLQMIRALLPEAKTIGIMYCTSEANSVSALAEYKELAPNYGFEIVESGISASADVPLAADNLLLEVDCMSNLTDNTVVGSLSTILDKANALGVPVFGSEIEQVKKGCVAAEGIDYVALGNQTGKMAAKILKGEAKASDLTYETISESQLYYNPEVLATYNLTLPAELAERAINIDDPDSEEEIEQKAE
ncbi:MAG: ABC transporter substrate-binding protein [Bacillota bacterium]|nr:ABC transporter substrate-binding protein [Bacillota bacterium]